MQTQIVNPNTKYWIFFKKKCSQVPLPDLLLDFLNDEKYLYKGGGQCSQRKAAVNWTSVEVA